VLYHRPHNGAGALISEAIRKAVFDTDQRGKWVVDWKALTFRASDERGKWVVDWDALISDA